ncbi:hypothetical protein LTR36_009800 [Oleoguttula mirabilis]|uniref:Uncharacterized protein n=1 Tax=Oleoguttula mirabilis TaxID=1507867 RepID=A0AAV9J589_9PEZI|nr:hypothetical protein LTR36_009800 [Oleoguttula mirabilis]
MCLYKEFFFLCGCSKYKIAVPCVDVAVNVQGVLFCRQDPHPHPEDRKARDGMISITHGPGVCSGAVCQWHWGVLVPGDFGDGKQIKPAVQQQQQQKEEVDAEFDLSEEACKEREGRWYCMLSADQQLECFSTVFPVPFEAMSDYARSFLNPHMDDLALSLDDDRAEHARPEELRWQETNPRYLSSQQLSFATGLLLPVEVTAPGQERGSTPHKPLVGPFGVGAHVCKPKVGVCRTCGRYRGRGKGKGKVVTEAHVRPHRNLGMSIDKMVKESARTDGMEWMRDFEVREGEGELVLEGQEADGVDTRTGDDSVICAAPEGGVVPVQHQMDVDMDL